MYEDYRNLWSLSRPLLSLILVNPEYFGTLEKNLCEPNSEHGAINYNEMRECFVHLMQGIEKNLHLKTKDRFTQNMTTFRREVSNLLKSDPTRPREGHVVDLTAATSNRMMS